MKLTEQERSLLGGEAGYAARKAMEILVALGRIYGAERLLEVSSVQVSGVSFHNLGDSGLDWLEEMAADGRALAMATLNPAGMDLERWREQGIDQNFAERQLRVVNAYRRMGIAPACTCTPYLIGNVPLFGQHLAWAESSAVGVANTVFGARTNREGGPSALASALTGRTPAYGLHLDDNRRPTLDVMVDLGSSGEAWTTDRWGALGCALGRMTGGKVPLLRGVPSPGLAELKSLCASAVTFGGSPLIHIEGVTPEAGKFQRPREGISISSRDLKEARASLNDEGLDELDMVCLGCPHASLDELVHIASHLEGKQVSTKTWICTARQTADTAEQLGIVKSIESSGAKVVCDTCFVVAPLKGKIKTVATDSAKGCFYARGHNRFEVRLGSQAQCLEAAVRGRWS